MLTYLLMWWRKSARPPGLIVAAEAEAEGAKGKNYCDSETLQSYVLNRQPPLASPLIGRLRHSEPLIGCCQASVQVLKASNTGTFHFCSRLPDSVSLMSGSDHPRPVIKTQHYKETSWHWDIPQVTAPPPPPGTLLEWPPGLEVLLYDGGRNVDALGHTVHPAPVTHLLAAICCSEHHNGCLHISLRLWKPLWVRGLVPCHSASQCHGDTRGRKELIDSPGQIYNIY